MPTPTRPRLHLFGEKKNTNDRTLLIGFRFKGSGNGLALNNMNQWGLLFQWESH